MNQQLAKEQDAELLNVLENKCTCVEDSKRRALCPVCDKKEYEQGERTAADTLKTLIK